MPAGADVSDKKSILETSSCVKSVEKVVWAQKESEMKMFWAVLAVVVSFALAASLPLFVYGQLAEAEPTTRNGFGLLSIIGAVFVFVGCLRFCVTGSPFKTIAPPYEDKK